MGARELADQEALLEAIYLEYDLLTLKDILEARAAIKSCVGTSEDDV